MLLDLNSTPPDDEGSDAAHQEATDLEEDDRGLHEGEEAHSSMDLAMPDVQDATAAEEPEPHWINQARDLQVILAAAGTGCFADEDSLRPDGSQESYDDIYRDLLMADYSRDESFRVVCGVDKYRMRFAITLSQLAIFLSKRSDIDLEVSQLRNPTPEDPLRDGPLAPVGGPRPKKKYRKMLTNKQRWTVYQGLLKDSKSGRLKKTSTAYVARKLGHGRRQVQEVWKLVKECIKEGREVDVSHRKTKNCGRKRIIAPLAQVQSIPKRKRQTLSALCHAIHMSKTTLFMRFKQGYLRRISSSLKPVLKDHNKKQRLQFCIRMIDQNTIHSEPQFVDMEDIVHIDEKWFNMTKNNRTYYLMPEEEEPVRTIQNKNYIGKVMFLVAVARPRYDDDGNLTFDGKIGCWAMVTEEPAKRRSDNRPRGTMVKKNMKVNRDRMREFMVNKVVPAIHEKWPDEGKTTYIQQDNAPSHVKVDDEALLNAIALTGRDIQILQQPPNSPDMNILDLGFFRSLQSFTKQLNPTTIDELIEGVLDEFNKYEVEKINRNFLTLQSCMLQVMRLRGGNWYKIPHMNKGGLLLQNALPDRLYCDNALYWEVVSYLAD
ncbi:hypothetical protein ACQ4PT_050274 [Festuca glaucescens]